MFNDVFIDFKLLIMTTLLTSPDGLNDEDYKRILERIEDIMEGYMRSSTHMVNELARIRKPTEKIRTKLLMKCADNTKRIFLNLRRF